MSFMAYFNKWRRQVYEHKYKLLLSGIFLLLASFLSYQAASYAERVESVATPDLILDFLPPMDLTFLFVYVWLAILFFFLFYSVFMRVEKFHSVLYHFSLLIVVRSFFIILTHLKTPLGAVPIGFPWPFDKLAFENDLFFSGHTAFPLIGFFVFHDSKVKYLFLAMSLLMGFTVLAMHQHYSIDVFAAYFIVYGTYHFGEWIASKFRKRGKF